MTERLDVYLCDRLAGALERTDGRVSFRGRERQGSRHRALRDGRVVDVPEGKKAFVMNASGKDSFVIRRGGKLFEVSCKSGDWIEL